MKYETETNRSNTIPGLSRRRDVRVEPPSEIRVVIEGINNVRMVRDISYRGICVVADAPLPLRAVRRVTLTLDCIRVECRARAIHCHKEAEGWLSGLEFLEAPVGDGYTVDDLINAFLSTSISFD